MRLCCNLLSLGCLAVLVPACGTSGGNNAMKLAGEVVSGAMSGSGRSEKPPAWSEDAARCGVFKDHRMACPQLRNCGALLGSVEQGLTTNVCVNRMGGLDAVKWCNYSSHWCRATAFPSCEEAATWPCDDFETVVCEEPGGRQRVMRSDVDAVNGRCSYRLASRFDEEPPTKDESAATP